MTSIDGLAKQMSDIIDTSTGPKKDGMITALAYSEHNRQAGNTKKALDTAKEIFEFNQTYFRDSSEFEMRPEHRRQYEQFENVMAQYIDALRTEVS